MIWTPPTIVELVGPAGAGKTALARILSQHSQSIALATPPYFRRIRHIPFFAINTLALLPTFLDLYRNKDGDWLTSGEIAWMTILNGWHHTLRQQASNTAKVVILDQGPVYLLARLSSFGSKILKSRSLKKWWKGMYQVWSATLDMVIWLDTADSILVERIRARETWHVTKGKTEAEAFDFLAASRAAYQQVFSALANEAGGPRLLRFDTSRDSLEEIKDWLLISSRQEEAGESIHTPVQLITDLDHAHR
jgi:thymidylate kinase